MLGDSVDSLFATFVLAGRLTIRQFSFLIIALGVCDGIASYVGPEAPFVPIFLHAEIPIMLVVLALFVLRDWQAGRWPLVILAPIALCYDNLFSYAGHRTTAICSLDFGLVSCIMASLGGLAFFRLSAISQRISKVWHANG
jgi:hypothetical protein